MRRRGIGATGVAMLVLALSGCGGGEGDDESAGSTPTTTESSSSTTDETTTSSSTTTTAPTTTSTSTTTTRTTTTTTAPPPASATWDEFKNAEIPAMCDHDATTLVDGKDVTLGESEGIFELLQRLPSGQPAIVADIPSEAGPLTAVVADCNAGGVGWPNPVVFFRPGGLLHGATFLTGPSEDSRDSSWSGAWEAQGVDYPGRHGISLMSLVDGALEIYTSATIPGDAACCASASVFVTIRPSGDTFELVSIVRDEGD